jgi:hypothetical protein
MADYDNNLTGVLFKNDKGDNEKRPDYKGSAEIEGVQYWVSSWIRDGAKGKFMSMKYERKEQQTAAAPQVAKPAPVASSGYGAIDSDVPF